METLAEIKVRLDRVGVQLFKEEALEEPPKIPQYARSLEGTTSEGITQDEFWETGFKAGDKWTQIFPYGSLDEIKSMRAPKPIIRNEKAEWDEMKSDTIRCMTVLVAPVIATKDETDQKDKAKRMIKVASDKAETLRLEPKQVDTPKKFLSKFIRVLKPDANPPDVVTMMPPMAPKFGVLNSTGNLEEQAGTLGVQRLTRAERARADPQNPEHTGGRPWPSKRQDRQIILDGLRAIYFKHAFEVERWNDWIISERTAMQWWTEVLEGRSKTDRTHNSRDITEIGRCLLPNCNWTLSGKDVEFMAPPRVGDPAATAAYENHWHMPADPRNARSFPSNDYRDDGRGDKERLERGIKAYDNHQKHAHANANKNAVKQDPPEFKMRMTPEEFEDQKEQWRRYKQAHPPHTPEIHYDMLRSSMTVELYKVIKWEMDSLKGGLHGDAQVKRIMNIIEQNAVHRTPNEKYLKEFETIKQDPGEKVDPYLSRLRTAAVKIHIKKRGTCSPKTHSGITNHPCPHAARWLAAVDYNKDKGEFLIQDSAKIPRADLPAVMVDCPPCCVREDDVERREWMIKKQFLANMCSLRNKNQIYLKMQEVYSSQRIAERFDILDFDLPLILKTARAVEEVFERDPVDKKQVDEGAQGGAARVEKGKNQKKKKGGQKTQTQPEKKNNTNPLAGGILLGKCCGCKGEPHGPMKNGKPTNNRAVREANCPAWKITCDNCGKQGHYKKCCQAKPKAQVQGSGAEVTKEANQPQPNNGQEVTKVAAGANFIQQMLGGGNMDQAWDKSVYSGAGTIIWADENSEPLFPENCQETGTQQERVEAGNA